MFFNRLVPGTTNTDKQFKKEIYFLWRKPKKMKHAKRLFCGALALLMALSLAVMPAFAANDGNSEPATKYTKLPINLTFGLTRGVKGTNIGSVPQFKVTVSLKKATLTNTNVWSTDALTNEDEDKTSVDGVTAGPLPTKGTGVTNSAWDDKVWTFDSGKYSKAGDDDTDTVIDDVNGHEDFFDFSGVTFEDSGIYAYELTLTSESLATRTGDVKGSLDFLGDNDDFKDEDGNELTHTHTYPVLVSVSRDDDGALYISSIIVKAEDGKSKVYSSGQNYAAIGETLDYVKLTITNEVVGTAADPDDEFNYWIMIPAAGDEGGGIDLAAGTVIKGTKYPTTGGTGEEFDVTVGDDGKYFTLKEGESVVLYVPDTMIYTIKQLDDDLTTDTNGIENEAPEGYSTVHQYGIPDQGYDLDDCDNLDTDGVDEEGDQLDH
jgi:hypothetical protein